jgi:serine/threonine protein phosphatase PrpC
MTTKLRGGAATDVGRVRQVNEDRYLVTDGLYAVADGVGGHQAGEVASQTSVEALEAHFKERTVDGLVDAIQSANEAVWRLAQSHAEKRGMGTTITALALVDHDGEEMLALANVGDSRGYLFQLGDLVQVTEDHSLVEELVREGQLTPEEAQVHPQRSIITRALGMEPAIEVDAWTLTPYAGDRILLCSDGLTNEVSADRIAATLRQLSDPQEAARELVRQARAHGGNDNITVVVVDIVDDGGRAEVASAELGREKAERTPAGSSDGARSAKPSSSSRGWPDEGNGGGGSGSGGGPGGGGSGSGGGGWPATATAVRTRTVTSPPAKPDKERPRLVTWRVLLFVSAFLAVLGVVAASITWYGRSAYFVGVSDGQVAIFKGRPGGFLWFEPTLVERKPLTLADVLPAKVHELRRGKEEGSKADADRYVNNLRQEAALRAATTSTLPPALEGDPTVAPSTTTTVRITPP